MTDHRRTVRDRAEHAFARVSGREPSHVWWVPGRLELFGKHTDYGGGRTLVAALPRGFVFAAARRQDDRLVVVDASANELVDLSDPSSRAAPGGRHVHVAAARLARNFPGVRAGATIVFVNDLPRSAGMSSSSALTTGVATALIELWQCAARDEWRRDIASAEDIAVYCACLESGRTFGSLEGDAGVGTQGGSEDHSAILLSKAGHVSAFQFGPLRRLEDIRLPAGWQIVVATSGVTASKSGARRDDYNRLSGGVAELLRLWNAHEGACTSLADALDSSRDAPARLRELIHVHGASGWTADALERRLAHFEIEDALVDDAARAIRSADAIAMGEIALASQERAELLLGNQTPETAALARTARATGAYAASSFGAGFGGAVWALVAADDANAFMSRWLAAYRTRVAAGARALAFLAPPSEPLTCLRKDMKEQS